MNTRALPAQGMVPEVVLITGAILWGVVWWPLKYFHQQGIHDNTLIFAAYGLVTALTLPALWRQRLALRGQIHWLVLLAFLGGYANLAFVTALTHGQVVRVMMLFYLAPVWSVLGGRVFLQEQVRATRWLAVVVAISGAAIIVSGPGVLSQGPSLTDLLALTAGMAYAMNNVTCRAAQHVSVGGKSVAVFAGCAVLAGLLLAGQGEAVPALSGGTWVWLAVFAMLWLFLATVATQYGVTHMEAGRAAVLLLMELVAAVLSAVLFGEEILQGKELIGGGLILGAAILEARG